MNTTQPTPNASPATAGVREAKRQYRRAVRLARSINHTHRIYFRQCLEMVLSGQFS